MLLDMNSHTHVHLCPHTYGEKSNSTKPFTNIQMSLCVLQSLTPLYMCHIKRCIYKSCICTVMLVIQVRQNLSMERRLMVLEPPRFQQRLFLTSCVFHEIVALNSFPEC